jgi:hypothetical protein
LWGLAWAALVFGELRGAGWSQYAMVIGGSLGMIAGVTLIGSGAASGKEKTSQDEAILRECDRYHLDYLQTLRSLSGVEGEDRESVRHWWDYLIMVVAVAFFVWFAASATVPPMNLNPFWIGILGVASLGLLAAGVFRLWRTTGFS